MPSPSCKIDRDILNEQSIESMDDIALSFFASTCGKNRGAFVLDPPDGNTYGCLGLPEDVAELAGIDPNKNITLSDANAINLNFAEGNITGAEAVSLLDFLVERVYDSTPSKESNLYACDVNGLARLSCEGEKSASPRSDGGPIRSVNLVDLLVPDAPWMTNATNAVSYTSKDFRDMKAMGLNTVQIAVPTSAFLTENDTGAVAKVILAKALDTLKGQGLQAILSLVATGDEIDSVVSASEYASSHGAVLGIVLPKEMKINVETMIDAVRAKIGPDLPLFVPLVGLGDLVKPMGLNDPKVYAALEWSHTSTIADIASSSSQEDRSKLFYHETVACTMRSPIEHSACFGNRLPVFWSSGFDLSIDDCAWRHKNNNFMDYGQCNRFEETIGSEWWESHRASFAARQLFAAERGLGWSYSAWKIPENEMNSEPNALDDPVGLLSLKAVNNAGLFPDLNGSSDPAKTACLNSPTNDFVLGDETLEPSASPPPDCGNGWWNFTTSQCDYWVPPTLAPTKICPVCDDCSTAEVASQGTSTAALIMAMFFGAAAAHGCGILKKSIVQNRKRIGYSPVPNDTNQV